MALTTATDAELKAWLRIVDKPNAGYSSIHHINHYKYVARNKTKTAIRRGVITPPDHCEDCGDDKLLEIHHPDYNSPLDIKILCMPCHKRKHRKTA